MSIKKLRNRKDENIISGIREKDKSFLLLSGRPFSLSFSLSFYFIANPNPHVVMSRSHKLITLASNTTHKIV
jgi:hypothetical protein